ncbi:hypothetical protein C4D16_RS17500 [Vibrio parahaemolyticus]|uniref:hypothetical protein n=1 Tax=Vibrio parahaemolyticus TaxID=670 RepID=UPI0007A081AA|nr:hypothetical protein [Vibrio parahaemolyticus]EJG0412268.1 hypothetical protein [Vibrio parahaemolyticus]KYY38657.1 hypothetical protein AWQ12_07020 [Vibrio parahaemolyticus]
MKVSSNWCDLKKIGDTKFVTSMYVWIFVVPLLVKAFEYVEDDKLVFHIFQQPLSISTSLPFSWAMFYFSALCLALGNLVYLMKCPKIIKEHPTYQSYLNEGKKLKQLEQYCEDISFNWGALANEIESKRLQISNAKRDIYRVVNNQAEHYKDIDVEDPVHYFWPIHEFADVKFVLYRYICLLLFSVGFVLFGVVTTQNLLTVISFLVAKT